MVAVSNLAIRDLQRSAARPGFFEMPAINANLISFCVLDLEKRVKELRKAL
jgi:hypothetical protein